MRTLTNCGSLFVGASPIEGFGVFAKDFIKAGTILEEVPFILWPRYHGIAKGLYDFLLANNWVPSKERYMENLRDNLGLKHPDRYYFKWHPKVPIDGDSMYTVLPLGFGPIYNTSNTNNNADWKIQDDVFIFKAEKDIYAGQEIRTFYGYFLGDDGTIFNCEQVFHLAIDMFEGVHKLKLIRFGSVETLNQQRNNPAALKFNTFIAQSKDGVSIKNITLLQSNGTLVYSYDVPESLSLTKLYQKLFECNAHTSPLVKFRVQYLNKQTEVVVTDEVLWKK